MKIFPRNHREMRFCANGIMITKLIIAIIITYFSTYYVSTHEYVLNDHKFTERNFYNSCLYGLKVSGPEIRHLPVNNPVVSPENAIIFVRYFDVLMM